MAQIIHNISTPNDGLGEQLRTAFNNQNGMNTDLYTNKVDKVLGKDLSSNDFDNDAVVKLAGIEEGAEVNVQSDWLQEDDTADDYIKNKPEQLFGAVGYFDHNDVATQTTPLSYTSGVELQLTNDALGVFTDISQAPYGVSDIWDTVTNTFDFSALDVGDTVDLRVDLNVSTVSPTSTVKVFLRLAEGTANEYDVFVGSSYFKSVVTFENVKFDLSYYIGSEDVKDTPAKLIFISNDTDGEVKVNGWYNRIIRKSVNIVNISDDLLVRKSFFSGYAYDSTGSSVVSPLRPEGQGNYVYTGAGLVSISGFDTTLLTDVGVIYDGKELIIQNQTGANIILLNNDTAEIPFIFNNGLDLTIPTGEKIKFQYSSGFLVELFKSWGTSGGGSTVWGAITGTLSYQTDLQSALDLKLDKDFTTLTNATLPLAGTEEIAILQGGTTKKVAVSEFGGGGTSLRSQTYPFVVTNATSFSANTNWWNIRYDVANSIFNPLWTVGNYDTVSGVTNTKIGRRIIMYNQKVKEIALSYSTVSVETKIRFIYYEINPSGVTSTAVNNHIIHEVTIPATTGSSAGIVQPTVFVLPTAFTMSKGGMLSMVIFNNNTALTFKDFIAEVITEEVI